MIGGGKEKKENSWFLFIYRGQKETLSNYKDLE